MKINVKALFITILILYMFAQPSNQNDIDQYYQVFLKTFCGQCPITGSVCQQNIEYISGLPEAGNFNASRKFSDNEYNIAQVQFKTLTTDDYYGFPNKLASGYIQASGLLSYPVHKNLQPRAIFLFFHPTSINRYSIPSNELIRIFRAIGSFLASRNYAAVFPDGLGNGVDVNKTSGQPCILYEQQEALNGRYMMNSAQEELNKAFGKRNKTNTWKIITSGYSVGSAYAIWSGLCSLKQGLVQFPYCTKYGWLTNSFQFYALTGGDGPYDVSQTMFTFLKSNVGTSEGNPFKIVADIVTNQAKPVLSALTMNGYAEFSQNNFSLTKAFIEDFYLMKCSGINNPQSNCNCMDKNFNIKQALNSQTPNADLGRAIAYSACSKVNNGSRYNSAPQMLYGMNNSVYSFSFSDILTSPEFNKALVSATITGYGCYHDLSYLFIQLEERFSRPSPNTINFAQRKASGKVFTSYLDNSKFKVCLRTSLSQGQVGFQVDHLHGMLPSLIFTLNFANNLLKILIFDL